MSNQHSIDSFEAELEIDLTEGGELQRPEQRKTERQDTSASSMTGTVEFRDKRLPVRIEDLSLGGVGIALASRMPLNEECTLCIQLSVCGSDYELTMRCRVRHCESVGRSGYQAGLRFIQMSDATRDTLKLLLG